MIFVIQIFFLALSLLGIILIVSTKNVIHAAYGLGLTLIAIAAIYILLNAELLSVVQILLYAGGVVVLLIFGVMMTDRKKGSVLISEAKNKVIGIVLSLSVFSFLVYLFSNVEFGETVETKNQIKEIGKSFLVDHLVAFELIAFVLLVALVGASYLAKMSSDE